MKFHGPSLVIIIIMRKMKDTVHITKILMLSKNNRQINDNNKSNNTLKVTIQTILSFSKNKTSMKFRVQVSHNLVPSQVTFSALRNSIRKQTSPSHNTISLDPTTHLLTTVTLVHHSLSKQGCNISQVNFYKVIRH